ncbi:MAG: 4Fe-4S binding protein [Candidatus Coatesbacteria bacterium]|nr:4Fe-4S binding protein [Candidatus Coatesbacteria bacterium]
MAAEKRPRCPAADDRTLKLSNIRRVVQSTSWIVVVLVIGLGWRYPLLGYAVPIVMITGMVGGFVRGRYVCGWFCPRGAFFDRIMKPLSPKRDIPRWLRGPGFRWTVFTALMGFMVYQISLNPGSFDHWGTVFFRICVITTGIGVVLAILIHPRAWCSFCPIGTFQAAVGGDKCRLEISEGCVSCGACERACPINLRIPGDCENGRLCSRDCLKCPECQLACPLGLLQFPKRNQTGTDDYA